MLSLSPFLIYTMNSFDNYPPCFENYILSKQLCPNEQSFSGLYVESIEGINLKRLDNVADSFYQQAKDLIASKLLDALNEAKEIMLQQLALRNHSYSTQSHVRDFFATKNSIVSLAGGINKGIKVTRTLLGESGLSCFFIDFLAVRATSAVATNYIIRNKLFQIIATIPVQTDANILTVTPVQRCFFEDILMIEIEDKTLELFDAQQIALNCCSGAAKQRVIPNVNVFGFEGSSAKTSSAGIMMRAGLQCSLDQLLCNAKEYLKYPILHLLGSKLMHEIVASERVNFFTVYSKEWAMAKAEELKQKGVQGISTYLDANLNTLSSIAKDCFKCNSSSFVTKLSSV